MVSARHTHLHRMSAGKITAILALLLLPFPVSIPLALWLRGRHKLPDRSGLPSTPSHRIS